MWITSDIKSTSFRRTYMSLIRYTLNKTPTLVHSETFSNQSWEEIENIIQKSIRLYKIKGEDKLSWLYRALLNFKKDAIYQVNPSNNKLRLLLNRSSNILILRYFCILYCIGLLYLKNYSWKVIIISCILVYLFLFFI